MYLYTDKELVDKYNKNNSFSSDIVLVYDWQGNPIQKLRLQKEVFYIAVNENSNKMYAALITEDGGWNIISYDLTNAFKQ